MAVLISDNIKYRESKFETALYALLETRITLSNFNDLRRGVQRLSPWLQRRFVSLTSPAKQAAVRRTF